MAAGAPIKTKKKKKRIFADRERQIPYDITYMLNLKYDTNGLIYKTETDSQTWKTNLGLPKGKVGGGINLEFGINIRI